MLQKLSNKVHECLVRAEECARRAKFEPDPNTQRDFTETERCWLKLARSYQFSESLEVFSKHNKKRQDEAAGIVNRLAT